LRYLLRKFTEPEGTIEPSLTFFSLYHLRLPFVEGQRLIDFIFEVWTSPLTFADLICNMGFFRIYLTGMMLV